MKMVNTLCLILAVLAFTMNSEMAYSLNENEEAAIASPTPTPSSPFTSASVQPTPTPMLIVTGHNPTPTPTPCVAPSSVAYLTFNQHDSHSIQTQEIDAETLEGFHELRKHEGYLNMSCCFYISRFTYVEEYSNNDLLDINSQAKFDQLRAMGYDVNYVNTINWPQSGTSGLAYIGSPRFAVTVGSQNRARTTYHEYGHTKGLEHVDWDESLMYEVGGDRWSVSTPECNALSN